MSACARGSPSTHAAATGAAVLTATVLAACAAETPRTTGDGPSGEVVVFAAASLTDVFEDLAADVEADAPGLEVVLHLAGSQVLASQIADGAPADVYAAADTIRMDEVVAGDHAATAPTTFATTTLALAVEPSNPHGIEGLADLADPDLVVVLPAPQAPAGRYAGEALDAAGVQVQPASLERDVRAALTKVALGEADAAIVYATDVMAADDRVDGVPITTDIVARFPIVALADAPNPDAARAFVDHVVSDAGQHTLAEHGFDAP